MILSSISQFQTLFTQVISLVSDDVNLSISVHPGIGMPFLRMSEFNNKTLPAKGALSQQGFLFPAGNNQIFADGDLIFDGIFSESTTYTGALYYDEGDNDKSDKSLKLVVCQDSFLGVGERGGIDGWIMRLIYIV